MKKLLPIIILFFTNYFISEVKAQTTVEWLKSFGGTSEDYAYSIQQTNDSGYIVAGYTWSSDGDVTNNHGEYDYWIVKLSSNGSIDWQKTLGGTGIDQALFIQQTNDGGYIVVGGSDSNDGDVSGNHGFFDIWVVKLSSVGSIEWQKSLGGTDNEYGRRIMQTTDGGYIVAGYSISNDGDVTGNHSSADFWVVKLSSIGAIEWQKSLGGTSGDDATSIQQTIDGGYIVAGISFSNDGDVTGNHGDEDYWVVKLSNSGSIEWQKSLGGTSYDIATSIQQTNDGGYIVAGISASYDGDISNQHGIEDYWVVKLSVTGGIEWQKTLGGTDYDDAFHIQQTTDHGYIICGGSYSNNGDVTFNHLGSDYWIVKLTNSGIIEWQKSIGGTTHDVAYSIQQTIDFGYIVAGFSDSNNGDVTDNHGNYDFWIVKFGNSVGTNEIKNQNDLTVYPNPCNACEINGAENDIDLTITDVLGRIIKVIISQSANGYLINLPDESAGIFFIRNNKTGEVLKFIKE